MSGGVSLLLKIRKIVLGLGKTSSIMETCSSRGFLEGGGMAMTSIYGKTHGCPIPIILNLNLFLKNLLKFTKWVNLSIFPLEPGISIKLSILFLLEIGRVFLRFPYP